MSAVRAFCMGGRFFAYKNARHAMHIGQKFIVIYAISRRLRS